MTVLGEICGLGMGNRRFQVFHTVFGQAWRRIPGTDTASIIAKPDLGPRPKLHYEYGFCGLPFAIMGT